MEIYLENGKLVNHPVWIELIENLRSQCVEGLGIEVLKSNWLAAFESAVLSRVNEHKGKNIGVLFSGGVDSTFICHVLWKNNVPFTCYTVGFKDPRTKDPEDIIEARKVVAHYGWNHKECVLDLDALRPIVEETARMLDDASNPVTVGVGAVVVAAAHMAKKDSCSVLFGGLGSEEIFAGYHRHGKAQMRGAGELDDEAWRGLVAMRERDLIRDSRIGAALDINVPTPFMDPHVIIIAMQMPEDVKICEGHKKFVLREIAEEAGMPHDFAFRPKRAAQYGSRLHKTIDRLAARAGVSQDDYIQSLVSSHRRPS